MLDETDRDPNQSGNLILVYLGTSVSGVWDSGNTWNREHVWPQSLLGVSADNSTVNSASDLHNLKPSDPAENSSRGNKFFGNSTTSQTYEPRDEVKGDIARILFYMDIMYDELSLIEANEGNTYQMGNLDALLAWHIEDPVDDFEMYRNQKIEAFQGNRNPFIDHPEFADKIYGSTQTTSIYEVTYMFGSMIESIYAV
jgi:endonuclease I